MKWIKNKKGIALLLVLSSMSILTAAVVELSYDSQINYKLAINSKERLQAYYLAKSALNFSRLILKYQKQADEALNKAKGKVKSGALDNVEPLYRMVPLSSELLRGVLNGEVSGIPGLGGDEEEGAEDQPPEDQAENTQDSENKDEGLFSSTLGAFAEKDAEKFLDFEGDFLAEISEEQTKLNINVLSTLTTGDKDSQYDVVKKLIFSFFELKELDAFFENDDEKQDLVHRIGDWMDRNNVVNEYENLQRGIENSSYTDLGYKPKDGKMLTLSELRLIPGMTDDIYNKLKHLVTIYGKDEKVNICLGSTVLVQAMIYHYTHFAGCADAVNMDDEKMEELVNAAVGGCPEPDAIGAALNGALGLVDIGEEVSQPSPTAGSPVNKNNTAKSIPGAKINNCSFQFMDLLTKDNQIFNVKGSGTVGDTQVSISTILDISQKDANKWKYYYYRVE